MKRRNLLRIFLFSIFTFIFGWIIKKESENTILQQGDSGEVTGGGKGLDNDEIKFLKEQLTDTKTKFQDIVYQVNGLVKSTDIGGTTFDNAPIIQQALDDYKTVKLPSGTFMIDITGVRPPSNRRIIMEKDTILKALPHKTDAYTLLNMASVENIEIENGVIDGSRELNSFLRNGQRGHGVGIRGCKNITLKNTKAINCFGDGFYVGKHKALLSENITLDKIESDNCRRNGLSVVSVKGLRVICPKMKNINGTAPESGIIIEADAPDQFLQDIIIENPVTENCNGKGIGINLNNMSGSVNLVSITVNNHLDELSGYGIQLSGMGASGGVQGTIKIDNPVHRLNKYAGLYSLGYNVKNPRLIIEKPVVINCNTSNSSGPDYGSGIVIMNNTNYYDFENIGNIHINEPTVIDDRSTKKMQFAVYINNLATKLCENISIINPLKLDKGLKPLIYWNTINSVFLDSRKVSINYPASSLTMHSQYYTRYISNRDYTGGRTITLSNNLPKGSRITFIIESNNYLIIEPDATTTIIPSGQMGEYIRSNVVGSSLTLEKANDNLYTIIGQIGTWEVPKNVK